MKINHDTWVVVADGEKFLLLRNEGDADYPVLRKISKRETENPPARDLASDRPGRMPDQGGIPGKTGGTVTEARGPQSAMEETDWHRVAEGRFAEDLAERLVAWAGEGRFERLVVVADPRTLGVLRNAYGDGLKDVLMAEVDKDLTNLTLPKMADVLKDT
ncbi:baeRF12 domain-containing protein [Sinisalibacter lacisalsi]|uniref:Host attachment protein n=1 Tax=Sinisalibacter lacisalsi TaxID=1526570 RepID=A0ABQ1QKC4_9RHOB|nr:host attachment family protein [Sinisalibacter lacisalsi]GGD27912.1 host attachment protein [Sinisalibacter lacisalsi]